MIGQGLVHRDDGVDAADPAGLTAAIPVEHRAGHAVVVVGVEDRVDHVIDDDGPTAARSSLDREVERDRERQDAERVVEVRDRQLTTEGGPPAARPERPEHPLGNTVDGAGGEPADTAAAVPLRQQAPEAYRPARGCVPVGDDVAVPLLEIGAAFEHRRDLHLPAGVGE